MAALEPTARARAVAESVTLAITARAAALKADGADVISLSAGEPDFPTPAEVGAAGIAAIEEGRTRYTPSSGMPKLRQAASRWLQKSFGLEYPPNAIMATSGAKGGLHMALTTVVEPGDVVLVPAPHWVSYPDLIALAGGRPQVLDAVPEQGFVPTGAQVAEAAHRHGARGLILNYPNNPSGAVPTREQMQELVDAAAKAGLWILSDEIYGLLTYAGHQHVSPAELPGGRERTLVVAGPTKSHSFTGWRLAFLAGPADVIAAAGRIQSQVLGNPSTIAQEAAMAICDGDYDAEHQRRIAAFDERRRYLNDAINAIEGLALTMPQGAFYALIDARELCGRAGIGDAELTQRLLDETYLALVPGSAFGIEGFVRLSFAASMQELEEGVLRLQRFAESIR